MSARMSLILLTVIVALVRAQNPSSQLFGSNSYRSRCLDPNKFPGYCVPYQSCPGIEKLVPKHDAKFILQALSDYTCGFEKGRIYVCCPPALYTETTSTSTTEDTLTLDHEGIIPKIGDFIDFSTRLSENSGKKRDQDSRCICPQTATVRPSNAIVERRNEDLLPKKCGKAHSVFKLQDHPWTVLLRMQLKSEEPRFICAGALISSRYVLTAAHCVKSNWFPEGAMVDKVRVGEYDQSSQVDCIGSRCSPLPEDIEIEEIFVYPGFNGRSPTHDHDIALIRLKSTVEMNAYVQPICLPDKQLIERDEAWTAGWGAGKSSTRKTKAKLTIVSNANCSEVYEPLVPQVITDYKMCAGIRNDDESCQSGSPLMTQDFIKSEYRWILQGIFSLTQSACGTIEKPSIFTRVGKYRKWILDNMRE